MSTQSQVSYNQAHFDNETATSYFDQASVFQAVAARYNINARYLAGIYGQETNFGKNISTTGGGAFGPFQITPAVASQYGCPKQFQVNYPGPTGFAYQAIAAMHYLSALFKAKGGDGNWDNRNQAGNAHAVSAYNTGPNGAYNAAYVQGVYSKGAGTGATTLLQFADPGNPIARFFGGSFDFLSPGGSPQANAINTAGSALNTAGGGLNWLTNPQNLLMLVKVIGGGLIILLAINEGLKARNKQSINISGLLPKQPTKIYHITRREPQHTYVHNVEGE